MYQNNRCKVLLASVNGKLKRIRFPCEEEELYEISKELGIEMTTSVDISTLIRRKIKISG